jgi:hypothetical protein
MFLRVFHVVELNEVTVGDCGDYMAGAIVFVVGGFQEEKHADQIGLMVLHVVRPFMRWTRKMWR